MNRSCPNSECQSTRISKSGFYHRPSDGRDVQRFQCKDCGKRFSTATGTPACGQNKRRLNFQIQELLCSTMSQNRMAKILNTTRKTVVRKLIFLAKVCEVKNATHLALQAAHSRIQFDELETIEHTKCKPLSVALAVDANTRMILGFEVSVMPASGRLAEISRNKYGHRPDERRQGLAALLDKLRDQCSDYVHLQSDMCPRYASIVKKSFAKSPGIHVNYKQFKGAEGSDSGQGELKKLRFDPLFTQNHTFAQLRGDISRLIRKTWCTTKKVRFLRYHLEVYMYYHNKFLLKN